MSDQEPRFCSLVRDTKIDAVRGQLDTLATLRYRTGLSVAEDDRYQELCRNERALLHSAAPAAVAPTDVVI
jgi:hypothetical protein